MNRAHWIRDTTNGYPRKVITHCGMEGWRSGSNEYVTAISNRFEAYERLQNVTCKRCLKSSERISNGPWGCRR